MHVSYGDEKSSSKGPMRWRRSALKRVRPRFYGEKGRRFALKNARPRIHREKGTCVGGNFFVSGELVMIRILTNLE